MRGLVTHGGYKKRDRLYGRDCYYKYRLLVLQERELRHRSMVDLRGPVPWAWNEPLHVSFYSCPLVLHSVNLAFNRDDLECKTKHVVG